ncbi:MAG: mannose-1-phosphate guanylyltransferase [Spirochaetota bacterium]
MCTKVCIMAGGGGTRLFPLSQTGEGKLPKQFLSVIPGKTMLQRTVARVPTDCEVVVIPEKKYEATALNQSREIRPDTQVLSEPYGCNTAAAVLLAASEEVYGLGSPDTVLCFMPADHEMDDKLFQRLLTISIQEAKRTDSVVTIGIKPSRPETQYGYIKSQPPSSFDSSLAVEKFIEKPDSEHARAYLEDEHYYWNAGIFIARARVFLSSAAVHCPDILRPIHAIYKEGTNSTLEHAYHEIKHRKRNVSIDYALMEHIAAMMRLVPAPEELRWNDVGSFESLATYMRTDDRGNAVFDERELSQKRFNLTRGMLVCNYTDIPVYTQNCSDFLVVVTADGILIRPKQGS